MNQIINQAPQNTAVAPAHLLRRGNMPAVAAAASQGLAMPAHPRISRRNNRFTLVDAAGNEFQWPNFTLPVVVVAANPAVSKVWYDTEFDPNAEGQAPACWSDNGVGASNKAAKPQNTSCQACRWNQWGSARSKMTGKEVKACNDLKKIAVIVPGDPQNLIYELQIPPASLKFWNAYLSQITSQSAGDRAVDVPDVITELSFADGATGVLNFRAVGWIDETVAALQDQIWGEKRADSIIGLTDVPVAEVPTSAALPAPAAGQAAPFSQPAPVAPPGQHSAPPPPPPVQNQMPAGWGAPPPAQQAPTPGFPPPNTAAQPAPAAPEPAKRRRRTKAEIEAERAGQQSAAPAPQAAPQGWPQPAPQAAPAPQTAPAPAAAQPQDDLEIPAFLRKTAPAAAPTATSAPAAHGMVPPTAAPVTPDAGLSAALANAFALKT
jgi:hypothetical protein